MSASRLGFDLIESAVCTEPVEVPALGLRQAQAKRRRWFNLIETESSGRPGAARIGIVLHDFPAGGTERIAIPLANAWVEAGRTVTIFAGAAAGPALALVAPRWLEVLDDAVAAR